MEVLTVTKSEVIKEFFKKSVLPVAVAALLYCIFKSAYTKDGVTDYVWLFILCGLPFGIPRMFAWIVPGGSLGTAVPAELYYWWSDRRFCPGLAAAGGCLVYSLDHLSTDYSKRNFLYSRIALWKCGKRPLCRRKTDIHGPLEKLLAFQQPANTVSHSSAPLAVYTHSHSAYYNYKSLLPYPNLIERDKRNKKRSESVTLGLSRRRRSRTYLVAARCFIRIFLLCLRICLF